MKTVALYVMDLFSHVDQLPILLGIQELYRIEKDVHK